MQRYPISEWITMKHVLFMRMWMYLHLLDWVMSRVSNLLHGYPMIRHYALLCLCVNVIVPAMTMAHLYACNHHAQHQLQNKSHDTSHCLRNHTQNTYASSTIHILLLFSLNPFSLCMSNYSCICDSSSISCVSFLLI